MLNAENKIAEIEKIIEKIILNVKDSEKRKVYSVRLSLNSVKLHFAGKRKNESEFYNDFEDLDSLIEEINKQVTFGNGLTGERYHIEEQGLAGYLITFK